MHPDRLDYLKISLIETPQITTGVWAFWFQLAQCSLLYNVDSAFLHNVTSYITPDAASMGYTGLQSLIANYIHVQALTLSELQPTPFSITSSLLICCCSQAVH